MGRGGRAQLIRIWIFFSSFQPSFLIRPIRWSTILFHTSTRIRFVVEISLKPAFRVRRVVRSFDGFDSLFYWSLVWVGKRRFTKFAHGLSEGLGLGGLRSGGGRGTKEGGGGRLRGFRTE